MNDTVPAGRTPRRLRREARTVELMIRLYCRYHHSDARPKRGSAALCDDCAALLEYSQERVAQCRFGANKPTCDRCAVHCFRPSTRENIRVIMRYSGPRMTLRHPYLALRHLLDRH